jgi:hypothetical protein
MRYIIVLLLINIVQCTSICYNVNDQLFSFGNTNRLIPRNINHINLPVYHGVAHTKHKNTVWFFGGKNGFFTYSCDLFVFKNDKLEKINTMGDQPGPMNFATLVYYNHHLYLFGGNYWMTTYNDLYDLDLQTMTWSKIVTNQVKVPTMYNHAAVMYKDSMLVIHGGGFENRYILSFNTSSAKWSDIRTDPYAIHDPSVFIVGSYLYIYDVRYNQFMTYDIIDNHFTHENSHPSMNRAWCVYTHDYLIHTIFHYYQKNISVMHTIHTKPQKHTFHITDYESLPTIHDMHNVTFKSFSEVSKKMDQWSRIMNMYTQAQGIMAEIHNVSNHELFTRLIRIQTNHTEKHQHINIMHNELNRVTNVVNNAYTTLIESRKKLALLNQRNNSLSGEFHFMKIGHDMHASNQESTKIRINNLKNDLVTTDSTIRSSNDQLINYKKAYESKHYMYAQFNKTLNNHEVDYNDINSKIAETRKAIQILERLIEKFKYNITLIHDTHHSVIESETILNERKRVLVNILSKINHIMETADLNDSFNYGFNVTDEEHKIESMYSLCNKQRVFLNENLNMSHVKLDVLMKLLDKLMREKMTSKKTSHVHTQRNLEYHHELVDLKYNIQVYNSTVDNARNKRKLLIKEISKEEESIDDIHKSLHKFHKKYRNIEQKRNTNEQDILVMINVITRHKSKIAKFRKIQLNYHQTLNSLIRDYNKNKDMFYYMYKQWNTRISIYQAKQSQLKLIIEQLINALDNINLVHDASEIHVELLKHNCNKI